MCPPPAGRGNVYSITGTATLDARLPGQWFQLESGLHYNWHHHYDPTLGRYTQPDPLGFVDGPSVYGYAKGSPLRYVDRDGQFVDETITAGRVGTSICGVGCGVAAATAATVVIGGIAIYEHCNDECEKAKADAKRIYDRLTIRRIPQYRWHCRNNSNDIGHYNAIIEAQAALRDALRIVEAKCTPDRYGPDFEKWKRLANQTFAPCR